jgi:hypothetical protein
MIARNSILFFLIISINSLGQIKYEKGYFISNDDKRTDCLIKNNDWANNPSEFQHKLEAEDKSATATIANVKEFGVANSKYIRVIVKMDKSTEDAAKLTNNGNPEWVEQQVFLEVVVEGQARLYSYKESNLERYFYSLNGSTIEQLVYKVYRVKNDQMGINKQYISQLKTDLNCDAMPTSAAEHINYHSKKDWIDYFRQYDDCKGTKSVYYNTKNKFDINLRFTPGVDNAFIEVQTGTSTVLFDKSQDTRIGMELEFVLPVNKGKWSAIVEPTYRYYEEINEKYVNFKIQYRSIELPIGLRHHFFLSEHSKLFVDAAIVLDIDLNSTILMSRYYIYRAGPNAAVGLGYSYKKFGIEFRYYTPRNLTVGWDWRTDYHKTSLILGYKIF